MLGEKYSHWPPPPLHRSCCHRSCPCWSWRIDATSRTDCWGRELGYGCQALGIWHVVPWCHVFDTWEQETRVHYSVPRALTNCSEICCSVNHTLKLAASLWLLVSRCPRGRAGVSNNPQSSSWPRLSPSAQRPRVTEPGLPLGRLALATRT